MSHGAKSTESYPLATKPTNSAIGEAVFFDRPRQEGATSRLSQAYRSMPGAFATRSASDEFFSYMVTPRSGRWAFRPNGKAGSTVALHALFRLSFGHELSVKVSDPRDINPDGSIHRTMWAGVFRPLHLRHDVDDLPHYLRHTRYLSIVRNPADRAVSAFRYICRSHAEAHKQFADERIRMTAMTGFDWDKHCLTPGGFNRFLEYVQISCDSCAGRLVNNHFAPQFDTIRPDLFPPAVLGRLEDLRSFVANLRELLCPMTTIPEDFYARRYNKASDDGATSLLAQSETMSRIRACYQKDYEMFGYVE